MSELPENLIQQLRSGDGKGSEQLYELYYERVYALTYGILQNSADAQDAVQQTFIRVFQKIPTLKDDTAFNGWLMKIAQNESLKLLKSRKPSISIDDCTEAELSEPNYDERMLPEEALAHKETCRILHECIETLSAEQREAMTLFYFHEMKIKEIAELMDCSEATVKTRLFYARRHIADAWESHEGVRARSFNGAVLPVGEVFARLLRQETEQKRPKAAVWKGIMPSLYTSDSAGMAAGTTSGAALAVKVAAGAMACVIASACIAGFAAIGGDDDGKAGIFYGGFGQGQQEAQSATIPPEFPTYPYEPINVPRNQGMQQGNQYNNNNTFAGIPAAQQQQEVQNDQNNPAPVTSTQPTGENGYSLPENPQQRSQNQSEEIEPQSQTQSQTYDISMFAGRYINVNPNFSTTELEVDVNGAFSGKVYYNNPISPSHYKDKEDYDDPRTFTSFSGYLGSLTKIDEYTYSCELQWGSIDYGTVNGPGPMVEDSAPIYAYLPGKSYGQNGDPIRSYLTGLFYVESNQIAPGKLGKKGLDFSLLKPCWSYHIPSFEAAD